MTMATLYCGEALDVLTTLPDGCARCCVTSPPYWGLRDYGVAGQLGLERTPDEYVARLVAVFREVRRVLADDGTLWLNLGDSFGRAPEKGGSGTFNGRNGHGEGYGLAQSAKAGPSTRAGSVKPKDLVGIPWMVAFALRADGWWLRRDIIWSKPNPMPESVTDRPTSSHEYLFLLSKSARYFYDAAAIAEEVTGVERDQGEARRARASVDHKSAPDEKRNGIRAAKQDGHGRRHAGFNDRWDASDGDGRATRNARSVWEIVTQPYAQAHFATFPEELARRCIVAGSAPGDTVLDPFGGSGTVAQVATGNARSSIYVDLNQAYVELARQRIGPMLCLTLEGDPR